MYVNHYYSEVVLTMCYLGIKVGQGLCSCRCLMHNPCNTAGAEPLPYESNNTAGAEPPPYESNNKAGAEPLPYESNNKHCQPFGNYFFYLLCY